MIHYKDMTFCPFYESCQDGNDCFRALTEQVKKDAQGWWGGDDAPVSIFTAKPPCYVGTGKTTGFEKNVLTLNGKIV